MNCNFCMEEVTIHTSTTMFRGQVIICNHCEAHYYDDELDYDDTDDEK